jgi:hypothetical protein
MVELSGYVTDCFTIPIFWHDAVIGSLPMQAPSLNLCTTNCSCWKYAHLLEMCSALLSTTEATVPPLTVPQLHASRHSRIAAHIHKCMCSWLGLMHVPQFSVDCPIFDRFAYLRAETIAARFIGNEQSGKEYGQCTPPGQVFGRVSDIRHTAKVLLMQV